MGAPGTIVEGAEKPVMRAVVGLMMRNAVEAMRAKRRMVCGGWLGWARVEVVVGLWLNEVCFVVVGIGNCGRLL